MTDSSPVAASGFFVLRTPLLPFDELAAWSRGLTAMERRAGGDEELEAALAADRDLLRSRLRALLDLPEIREALFVAAPALDSGLAAWRRDPEHKKGRRAEEALVRYFCRMATRPTPFGLFAGVTLGLCGGETRLRLTDRRSYGRHTRLDMDYLFALTETLGRDHALRRHFLFRPSSSLYKAFGRYRFFQARVEGGARTHHLVALEQEDFLDHLLERARRGATVAELVLDLVAEEADDEEAWEEAEELIHELIDRQVLVSDLTPPVTGREPIHDLIEQLAPCDSTAALAAGLAQVRDALSAMDREGLGAPAATYLEVADRLRQLPGGEAVQVELPRLFQVDMTKPGDGVSLGDAMVRKIVGGIEALRLIFGGREAAGPMSRFAEAFLARYEGSAEVPLVEVLDEEMGIGFESERGAAADASPLLAGLAFPLPPSTPTFTWGPGAALLLRKLEETCARGAEVLTLDDADLASLRTGDQPPFPDAFHALLSLAAGSEEELRRGDAEVHLMSYFGPSGARLLGRFCHADATLRGKVEEHLRAEEAFEPGALYAEIVHLPEGRVGNVLARPVLRGWEIPFLGRSGAPQERCISISDLRVSVTGREVVLRSASLGCRVIPCLTTAHSLHARNLSLYRFLALLQTQNTLSGLTWDWGPLEAMRFLPRVTCAGVVLARARWRIPTPALQSLPPGQAPRFRALQEWRDRHRLPRWTLLSEGADKELMIDFENVLSLDVLAAALRNRTETVLYEPFPGTDRLPVAGPEGHFFHEIVLPFVSRRAPSLPRPARAAAAPARRSFSPGSEWLYFKLYTGTSTADQILCEVVRPVARHALAAGAADLWYFIRYRDPAWHLRVRLHGDPARLNREILPMMQAAAADLLARDRLWKLQIDTYDREVERYGGPQGIVLAEKIFHLDSEAVVEILGSLEGDEGATARWLLALCGIDRLLDDLGFAGEEKVRQAQAMRDSSFHQLHGNPQLRDQMADRLRRERPRLEKLLAGDPGDDPMLAHGLAMLTERSRRLAPVAAVLRSEIAADRLTAPLASLAGSFCHMFTNRLLRSEGPSHEVLLYDFLHRLLQSKAARAQPGAPG